VWEQAVARALDAPRDPAASRRLALPFDWDRLAGRMVEEIERLAWTIHEPRRENAR